MPLKEADLKNLDACKRAFKQDAQRVRSGAALRVWIYQKVVVERETHALFPVLVDDRGVREALQKSNSALVCQGIVRATVDGRALIFETDAPALNANELKKIVALLMGTPDVVVRVVAGAPTYKGASPH